MSTVKTKDELMNQNLRAFMAAWHDLEAVIELYRTELNLSFGLEYSSVVDWVADLTPRRGHAKARQYGEVWRGQGSNAADAIMRAIRTMRDEKMLDGTWIVVKNKPNVPVPAGPILTPGANPQLY